MCIYICVYVSTCDTVTTRHSTELLDLISKQALGRYYLLSVMTMEWPTVWMNSLSLSIHSFISCEYVWRPEVDFGCSTVIYPFFFFWGMVSYWLTDQDAPGLYLSPPPWCCGYMCAPLSQTLFWKTYFLCFLRLWWNYIIFSFPFPRS